MSEEFIKFDHDGTQLEAFVSYDEAPDGPRPLVLIAHAWAGRGDFEMDKARALAKLGYIGFAMDMYGEGKLGTSVEENTQLMTPFMQDRALLRDRMITGLTTARQHAFCDTTKVAAIGFCFGGLCILDLARSGTELNGVVSFHGLLGRPESLSTHTIKANVLALHGYDDPMATPDTLINFANEMTEAKADWQIHAYGHTQHAFTNPEANDPELGTIYNPVAEKRSWQAMKNFLEEIF